MIIQKINIYYTYIIIISIILGACSNSRISNHGTIFTKKEINIIKNTKLNKSEIIEILGQPSTKSTFSDDIWYYIANVQREKGYFKIKTISNSILKIVFNKKQQVISYNYVSNGKTFDISINKDKTFADLDKDGSFWQDFLSSFARRLKEPARNF